MTNWYFFPCERGTKKPALTGDWRVHSTADPVQVDAWVAEGYNLAIDCEKSGLTVIDLDGGDIGEATLAQLQATHGPLDPTYEVRTPKGGRHLYFEGVAPSSVQKLGPKVDTRGRGGYVLWEGSTPDGSYEVVRDVDVAALPDWVPTALGRAEVNKAAVQELDQPQNIARAITYLQGREPVEQGGGADSLTYEVAALLRDFGISAEKSIELMLEHYKCQPQDARYEAFITRKVDNAWEYGQNEPGAWGVATAGEVFGAYLESLPEEPAGGGDSPNRYHALTEAEQDALGEPKWIMPGLLPDNSLILLVGQPGTYKSFLALDIGMTLATGQAGWDCAPRAPLPVVYVAGEGPRSIARLRRPAWRAARGVDGEVPFHLVQNMPLAWNDTDVPGFVQAIKDQGIKPGLVVIDTWARFVQGLNENDAKDAGRAIGALDYIKRELHCSVLVVHHSSKGGTGARGSSAIEGGVDALHEVEAHKATKALIVHNRRQKDADERRPWHFEGQEKASSLVFRGISTDSYRQLTTKEGGLGPRTIAPLLQRLGALDADHAVTTSVLASELYHGAIDELPEDTLAARDRLARQLRASSRGTLEAYANPDGREVRWHLP